MIVGSKKVLLADEISTGLDSSTTYQIVRCMRNVVKMRRATVLMSLLQPAPETFQLFDDVMLLAEGGLLVPRPSLALCPHTRPAKAILFVAGTFQSWLLIDGGVACLFILNLALPYPSKVIPMPCSLLHHQRAGIRL